MSIYEEIDGGASRRQPAKYSYDVAQVCLNGHLINARSKKVPARNSSFCVQCSAKTIQQCANCHAEIPGARLPDGLSANSKGTCAVTPYCGACGKPYPWTAAALDALAEMLTLVQAMSLADREAALALVPDLLSETPKSTLAIVRWNGVLSKAKGVVADGIGKILVGIATKLACNELGLNLP